MRPRICVTSGRHPFGEQETGYYDAVRGAYSWCVAKSGGIPFVLPVAEYDPDFISEYLDVADGLLLSGGEDIHPSFYGEIVLERCGVIDEKRDLFEIELFRGAVERGMPVLGICRGMQLMAVALGGSLYQDLSYCEAADDAHGGAWQDRGEMPSVTLTPGSVLHDIFREGSLCVNCQHHQLIKTLKEPCTINAVAADGVIEGIELSDRPFVLGVHWHPERLADRDPRYRKLFEALVKAAIEYSARGISEHPR
ncbi:MAG: gamma-glutamyl-gamma-aminobutyrate hydrolase family protein [Candidatus Methylomirabilales bacterium]